MLLYLYGSLCLRLCSILLVAIRIRIALSKILSASIHLQPICDERSNALEDFSIKIKKRKKESKFDIL